MIDSVTAIQIARKFDAQPTALAAIAKNDQGYVVGFEPAANYDPYASLQTWVDGTTGKASSLSATDYAGMMPSLQLLGRGIPPDADPITLRAGCQVDVGGPMTVCKSEPAGGPGQGVS